MKTSPKVTVYITSHNYGTYLEEAIASVERQTFSDWELILINDGSTDNTQEIMDRYKGSPNIQVFSTSGVGLPAAANVALKHAQGEYFVRLDADDTFEENILLVLSTYLDAHPDVALVFPDFYLIDDHGELIRHEMRNPILGNRDVLDMPANGACTMIRASVLNEIGGYREDLGAQDGFDIWTKITKKYSCANVNLPLFYYRRHNTNLTSNTAKIAHARRTIKRDAVEEQLHTSHPVIAIIPCRSSYDIEPDLWSKKVNNLTLLDIVIRTNLASDLFDYIVVTADTTDVQDIMSHYDDKRIVFVSRTKKQTAPATHIFDTIQTVADQLDPECTGVSVVSYIQAPFTTTATLEEAVYTLLINNADSSMAVQEVRTNLYKRSPTGLVSLNNQEKLRTDFDVIYNDARATFATRNNNKKKNAMTHLMGDKFACFEISTGENFFINSKHDLQIISYISNLMRGEAPNT